MPMPKKVSKEQIEESIKLAEQLQSERKKAKSNPFAERMAPIITSPEAKHFLIKLMDVAFRSHNYTRVSHYVIRLFKTSKGQNKLFTTYEKTLVRLYKMIGYKIPSISIPLMLDQIRDVTSPIVYILKSKKFRLHTKKRKSEGIKLNVNLIGEALIGEAEAEKRIQAYIDLLNQPEVDYISIKISTIYSQIHSLAHDYCVEVLDQKLSILYDEVLKIEHNTGVTKFVNLDMEEYRDLHMTIDTFKRTLSNPKYKSLRAGIVLQAYLPDSYDELISLRNWALHRVENGGAPIKIRIVKGANLEMEKTESSLEEWPIAPYSVKAHSDANYKKMLLEILQPDYVKAVNIGVASHNVFDLAFALQLVEEHNLHDHIDFEMLEGMAEATVSELLDHKVNVLLYTPIVDEEDYTNAIAYLVRRLDEGTQSGNFLKEGYNLKINSDKWHEIKDQFLESVDLINEVSDKPNRTQDRSSEVLKPQKEFKNVPNTDWTREANRKWIEDVKDRWADPEAVVGETIPVVGGKSKNREFTSLIGWNGPQPWNYELADAVDYDGFINGTSSWYTMKTEEKVKILRDAAVEIAKVRGNLIAVAVAELGKTIPEVDVEVSEAIDFANYYAQSLQDISELEGVKIKNQGVNLVLSPWNFPVAIPIGGVLASLAAGKRVILKPSQNAAACAYLVSKCLWEAGVPKDAFAFLPTNESTLGPYLSSEQVFDAVILTGGTDTAKFLLNRNPHLPLYAETGGKNSLIIRSLSDHEQAAKDLVYSAFGNTGQKCSAASIAILEEEIFNDPHFKELLKDAVESKIHGNPWLPETQIGPLAVPITDKIRHSIENTPDEEWLVKPEIQNEFFVTPGVKWGVTTDDYEYNTELFGPILSVMKARSIVEAIDIVNGVDYGLTSGIATFDPDEIEYWKKNVKAGNLYINRPITGAIVQRQPFGGMKASCFGFGMKAGGPNYVLQFAELEVDPVKDLEADFQYWYDNHFGIEKDYVKLRGQHNINRYLKPEEIIVFIDNKVSLEDIQIVEVASSVLQIPITYYSTDDVKLKLLQDKVYSIEKWSELESELEHDVCIRALNYDRLSDQFLKMCHERAIHVYGRKPVRNGRIELLNYLIEQNISHNYHRYGNLLGEQPIEG